jgi:hypothetical protein
MMFQRDADEFYKHFPAAQSFLLEAELRSEYWTLCAAGEHVTPWQIKRLEELRQCPACHEAWFVLEVGRAFGQWPDGQAEVGDAGS